MLKRVEPLRNELKALEDQAQYNVKAGNEVRDLIAQLEKSIASYKEEYAQLISQAQAIKTDLENVQAKVKRYFLDVLYFKIKKNLVFKSQLLICLLGQTLLGASWVLFNFRSHSGCNMYLCIIDASKKLNL